MPVAANNSFWGEPKFKTSDKDVLRFVGVIREITQRYGPDRRLRICTSAMSAICAIITNEHGPKETFAILDRIKSETARPA